MPREKIDRSEAILRTKRNTRKPCSVCPIWASLLYEESGRSQSTREIVDKIGYTYSVINYHLKNMLLEQVVEKEIIHKHNSWKITGLGQQTIKRYLSEA